MVVPQSTLYESVKNLPPAIQLTLDSAEKRQRNHTEVKIINYTNKKKQEFTSWRERARRDASLIAQICRTPVCAPRTSKPLSMSTPTLPMNTGNGTDLFPKSPVTTYVRPSPGASLAAANLTRSLSEQPSFPSPPVSKFTPLVPLSSSLKSASSSNLPRPVKRVMFQDPPDEEVHLDADDDIPGDKDGQADYFDGPVEPPIEGTISVDGIYYHKPS